MLQKIKPFFFQNQTLRQTIAKNTFWLFFGQIVSRLFKVILVIYAARVLGAEGYGLFSFALSFIMLFGLFSDIGIGTLLIRELVKYRDNKEDLQKYLSTSFYLKIGLLIVVIFVIIIACLVIPHKEAKPIVYVLIFMMIFNVVGSIFSSVVQSLEKMEIEAFFNITNSLIVVAAGLFFLKFYPSPFFLAIAYSLGPLAALIFIICVSKRYIAWRKLFTCFNLAMSKKILNWAWPFALSGLVASVMLNFDSLMLGWLRPLRDVGIYNAALKIPHLLFVPVGLIAAAIFPVLSRFAADKEKFTNIIKQSIQASFYLAFPIIVGGLILARPLIGLIFGQGYEAAYPIFQIILPMIFAVYVTNILNSALFVYNLQKKVMLFSALAAGCDIILNYLFIPAYGYFGAAISTLVAEYLVFLLILRFFIKTTDISPFLKEIKKPLLSAAAMGIFLFVPQIKALSIWYNIPLAALVYFVFLYLLKADIFKQIFSLFKFSEPGSEN